MDKTSCFDAAVELGEGIKTLPDSVLICVEGQWVSASFYLIGEKNISGRSNLFFHVLLAQPFSLSWKQTFTLAGLKNKEIQGKGTVLDPIADKFSRRQTKRRMRYLLGLFGNEKQMISAVVQYRGINGVHEDELIRFSHHAGEHFLELSQELESEGQIRILEFSPLFLISQEGETFLCDKVLQFLTKYHEKNPEEVWIQKEIILKRFAVHPRILTLALKRLSQKGQVKVSDDRVALSSFELSLLPEEEEILDRMEEMYLKDKFHSLSLEELQKSFRLSSKRLNKMLALLIERKKIVQGREGFILHSHWLESVVQKIRNSGKKELTVAEFKEMTGLTRKYAIPLLELLDQMGVTKRRGSSREIL